MYIRRKLYSNIEGEYVPVEQTVLFSAKDDAKGAAIGAGIAAGTAGIGAAGLYGAKKAADKAVSKAVENKNAILAGKIAGDFEKAEAKHEAASTARNKINKIINSTKGWLTNAEGKEAAKAYEKTIAGKSGAAKEEMVKKLARLNKAAKNTALKRQLGVGAAILGAGAGIGAGVAHLKGKKKKEEEKVYSVLMTEDELALFSEVAKDAGIGAGVGAGAAITAGGAALATKGAGVLERKLAKGRVLKAVDEKNKIMKEAGEKAKSEAKKWAGKKGVQRDMVMNAINSGKAKASNVKISDAGKIEKGLAAISKGGATATKWVKNNPKLAAGIAAGTIATSAAAGAGIGAVRGRNKD